MPDERIVNYMKERDRCARTFSCIVSMQLIVLALYFGMYIPFAKGSFYSLSEDIATLALVVMASLVAIVLIIVNILAVIRFKKVYITRPDRVSIRDAADVVDLAYDTARPVLIYKITYSLVMIVTGGLVYIMLTIFMDNQFIAGLYGRIICCFLCAGAFVIAYPCIDRIACYRALRGETHELSYDVRPNMPLMYILAFCVPISICVWYILKFPGQMKDTAFIVFLITALFALAIAHLAGVIRDGR